ncbi:hypothetical protein ACOQNP_18420 [Ectopseudomonas khazarica]|uniref:hypothetical protein n=1 Tax=Ectopseudomonas khazarica TaxID=2502979 RepID=UPI003B958402
MNTAPQLPHDYLSQMQAQAKAYLQAHQAEHLSGDTQLIERTTCHLVHQYDVPLFIAPRLVALAISDLQPYQKTWLGIDLASGPDSPGRHHFT